MQRVCKKTVPPEPHKRQSIMTIIPAAIAAKLNATMLGRCVLSHATGFDESDYNPDQWQDRLSKRMAEVFMGLAAEITVLLHQDPALTAASFARLLLAEVEEIQHDDEEDDEPDGDEEGEPDEWLTHPSLTVEQRNTRFS
jgi:hypothetical protein